MSRIDQYNLKASLEFPISGTQEITKSLQLTASTGTEAGVLTGPLLPIRRLLQTQPSKYSILMITLSTTVIQIPWVNIPFPIL